MAKKVAEKYLTPEEAEKLHTAILAQSEGVLDDLTTYKASEEVVAQVIGQSNDPERMIVKIGEHAPACWLNDNPVPPTASLVRVRVSRNKYGYPSVSYYGEIVE